MPPPHSIHIHIHKHVLFFVLLRFRLVVIKILINDSLECKKYLHSYYPSNSLINGIKNGRFNFIILMTNTLCAQVCVACRWLFSVVLLLLFVVTKFNWHLRYLLKLVVLQMSPLLYECTKLMVSSLWKSADFDFFLC